MGRTLRLFHALSVLLMLGNVALGYGVTHGIVSIARHIPWGFFSALVIAFTHAMTMFYFAGIGVSMREAASGRRWCEPYLQTAETLRRGLALPLGLAIISLMAAVILGGGSHTRTLPFWAHHTAALAALGLNLFASWRSLRSIRSNESLIRSLQEALTNRTGHAGRDSAAAIR
ncbi:MAG TPA: hypothetical protein VFE84_06360 [Patescibacteria group bacterium]|nr:hypothetical protein [Patescibacteria group bacterium]